MLCRALVLLAVNEFRCSAVFKCQTNKNKTSKNALTIFLCIGGKGRSLSPRWFWHRRRALWWRVWPAGWGRPSQKGVFCVWQKHSEACAPPPIAPTVAWHFEAKSCGMLASTCIWRRLVTEWGQWPHSSRVLENSCHKPGVPLLLALLPLYVPKFPLSFAFSS